MRHHAINLLYNNVHNQVGNLCFDVNGNPIIVDEELVQTKIAELEAAEPLRLLRIQRNQLLQETDWTQNRDVTLANDAEWAAYRQALRDLPNTATPELDEYGNLTNVTWPEKPE
jgi:hypothetical protein